MPIDPVELRAVLRLDAVSLACGALLTAAALVTLTLQALARRRAPPVLWLAIFALLYGVRLLARTAVVRIVLDVEPGTLRYWIAALTYTVPVPMLLFARTMMPAWHRAWTWSAAAMTAFAVFAILSDAVLGRPESMRTPNNVIVIGFIAFLLVWLFRPGLPPSRELRVVRIGMLSWTVTALADNLRGIGAVTFPGPDVEPFGFTVTVGCFGVLVGWRLLGDARRLAAIDRELNIARQIQFSILPQSMPVIPGLDVVARYRPMTAVAGDLYDFIEIDDGGVGVLVADVSGHGVPAALIASMVKVALAAQRDRAAHPAAVLAGMNEALVGRLAGRYVTAAYLFIDTRARLIRYAAAGHPPMLRAPRNDGEVRAVEQNGLILGFVNGSAYQEREHPMEAGDRLLLYTDGLIEAARPDDDLFGIDRLKDALAECSRLGAAATADRLLTTIDAWSGQAPSDDYTLVLVDWNQNRLGLGSW